MTMIRQKFFSILTSLAVALGGVTLSVAPLEAEAKRLGGSRPAGMQRQAPPKQQPNQPAQNQNTAPQQGTPAQQPGNTAAAAGGAGAAAQAGKRSWMGPIAGLAAGLGLAALASHLGFGEELANFMMMAVLAVVAMVAIGWLMRRFRGAQAGGPQLAGAGAGAPMVRQAFQPAPSGGMSGSSASAAPAVSPVAAAPVNAAAPQASPAGFDAAGFERIAKMIFIRLQAANDAGQVDDLRRFTTPELFASLRLDLQERAGATQQTDVLELNAELVDTAQENGQWVASVRFTGLIREEAEAGAESFNELWHLVRPLDESREWAIAGITPLDAI